MSRKYLQNRKTKQWNYLWRSSFIIFLYKTHPGLECILKRMSGVYLFKFINWMNKRICQRKFQIKIWSVYDGHKWVEEVPCILDVFVFGCYIYVPTLLLLWNVSSPTFLISKIIFKPYSRLLLYKTTVKTSVVEIC